MAQHLEARRTAWVRFKKVDDLSLDLVREVIAKEPVDDFVAYYEKVRGSSRKARSS